MEIFGFDAFSPQSAARNRNIVGGSVLVALVYCVIYLRGPPRSGDESG